LPFLFEQVVELADQCGKFLLILLCGNPLAQDVHTLAFVRGHGAPRGACGKVSTYLKTDLPLSTPKSAGLIKSFLDGSRPIVLRSSVVTSVTSISLEWNCFPWNGVESVHNPAQLRNTRTVGGGSYLTDQAAFANDLPTRSGESQPNHLLLSMPWALCAMVLAFLLLPGCNALNPLCSSSRPVPVMGSLSASTITFAQVQQGFVLTVTGKEFVASTVVIINGTTLKTTVVNSQSLQVTISTDLISGPGSASVTVNTPSGNSGDLGCTSGGTSSALTLTIT
jgi:hypothetical protein